MSNWKDIVRNLAPTLGTALSGGNPMIGAATKFIAEKLLGKPDATEGEISQYITTASPEQLATLKKIENDFAVQMKSLEVDVFALAVDNTKSARQMAEKTTLWPQIILGAIFMIGYFILLYGLVGGSLVLIDSNKEVSLLLIGLMTRELPTIMQFFYGSSIGSKQKSTKINSV